MVQLSINGVRHHFEGDATMPLLWFLREELALRGTHYGCGMGLCGCCTVHIDSKPVRSCSVAMASLDGTRVTTIEGLGAKGLHPVQVAWIEHAVPQCGYCQAGQIMQAAALLAERPKPTEGEIDEAMAGNLCRCGTYPRIRAAIRHAARLTSTEAARSEPKP